MSNNKELSKEELISVADKLYKYVNPETKMDTPSGVYVIVIEKWYPEFQKSESNIEFFDWCILMKQSK
jgi:hypothetical protein